MHLNTTYHGQALFNNRVSLPSRSWIRAVGHLLLLVVFMVEISIASADGLFDFQMKLAQKGNPEAEFKIGEMYETGFGTTKDMKLAKEWITKAAAQGHEMAKFKLLYWDMKKNGITKSNKAQFKDLTNKANSDNTGAEFYLGKIYAEGAGVRVDREKALSLYNKATLKGSIEAERAASQLNDQIRQEELAKKAAEQKREAALKAKREEELRKQQAAARLAAQKKAAAAAAASKQPEAKPKPSAKKADNQQQQAKLAAQQAADQKALEAKRQALLKQREEQEAKRKAEFDSDPCKGKSARFLSTCH